VHIVEPLIDGTYCTPARLCVMSWWPFIIWLWKHVFRQSSLRRAGVYIVSPLIDGTYCTPARLCVTCWRVVYYLALERCVPAVVLETRWRAHCFTINRWNVLHASAFVCDVLAGLHYFALERCVPVVVLETRWRAHC
jgi:hypothetical protein